jgi:hypothetical protein
MFVDQRSGNLLKALRDNDDDKKQKIMNSTNKTAGPVREALISAVLGATDESKVRSRLLFLLLIGCAYVVVCL